ncbi:Hpt domain-containing protein [Pseudarthrobacter sp. NS4]|uniref:Hpt domain-containing protein n=1 Tax=Pseudarthrobacter sp. NS4 TaxID=2973976 RepID=UPI002161AACA|nr:Hpt domain-containing protein [Pseudarthrobacter sp. NS4]
MAKPDAKRLPLLDESVLKRLSANPDDGGVWKVFIHNFLAHLPKRIEELRWALSTGDLTKALDAVHSLKTSSQMVGAEQLADLASKLELSIRDDSTRAEPAVTLPRLAAAHLRGIKHRSQRTTELLHAQLRSGI